jgi:hypothetical protein
MLRRQTLGPRILSPHPSPTLLLRQPRHPPRTPPRKPPDLLASLLLRSSPRPQISCWATAPRLREVLRQLRHPRAPTRPQHCRRLRRRTQRTRPPQAWLRPRTRRHPHCRSANMRRNPVAVLRRPRALLQVAVNSSAATPSTATSQATPQTASPDSAALPAVPPPLPSVAQTVT